MEKSCICSEGRTDRIDRESGELIASDVPTGLFVHDCEYVQKRNSLGTEAAREFLPLKIQDQTTDQIRGYLKRVDQLARERGIVL